MGGPRSALALLLSLWVLAIGGCSTARPWINQPLPQGTAVAPLVAAPVGARDLAMTVAVTLSGGGARAAAFGYGVLDGLRQTRFAWNGQDTSLLDEVDVISGVSGGSIVAAYYAAFGTRTFAQFEPEFLRTNFQRTLIDALSTPAALQELTSPWIGRSHLLERRLGELYRGKTFGDLQVPGAPRLLVTATDLSLGTGFEFTPEQFDRICSDLSSVPLSFAVAASSAVPLVLSPLTLRNYGGQCPESLSPAPGSSGDYRARLLESTARSYRDSATRPYIHLVDGGLADNLGVRQLLDRTLLGGGLRGALRDVPPRTIRKLVLITVNSERDPAARIDASDRVPTTLQVFDALLFGAGARATQETLGMLSDAAHQWQAEMRARSGQQDDVFAPDAQVYVITLNLRDAPDRLDRNLLMQVPTAFTIAPGDVDRLIEAGREVLRESPGLRDLLRSLQAQPAGPAQPP